MVMVRSFFAQAAEAVRYLHLERRVVHNDIKLENLLLDHEANVKLCDFGLSHFIDDSADQLCATASGSLQYCPPEQLASEHHTHTFAVDIWALGCVLYALLTGRLPFNDSFEPRLTQKIILGEFEPLPSYMDTHIHQLVNGMLAIKPAERWNISQVLGSPFCRP